MTTQSTRTLAALLSLDAVGSSRLMEADEAGTLARLGEFGETIITPVVAGAGGRIVKSMGDGYLCLFTSATAAAEATIAIQRGVAAANEGVARPILYRAGLNIGDVIITWDDVFGDEVNLVTRVQELAEPGAIAMTAGTRLQILGKVDLVFTRGGMRTLKNIAKSVEIWHARAGGAADSVPSMVDGARLADPGRPAVAVLPFTNMSEGSGDDYLVDGVTEGIITALSRHRAIFVIARNSTFIYKGRNVDVTRVSRDLGVRYVLEGSVIRAGLRLRTMVQLIDAIGGHHVWAKTIDTALDDIFAAQDEIAAQVAGQILPKLYASELAHSRRKPDIALDAYDYYLRAVQHIYAPSAFDKAAAARLLGEAVKRDPNYCAALALLSWLRPQMPEYQTAEEHRATLRLARAAIQADPEETDMVPVAAAVIGFMTRDFDTPLALIDRAMATNPNSLAAYAASGWLRAYKGDADIAVEHLIRAKRLSPLDPIGYLVDAGLSLAYFVLGDLPRAIESARVVTSSAPSYETGWVFHAAAASRLGLMEEAGRAGAELMRLAPYMTPEFVAGILPFGRKRDGEDMGESLAAALAAAKPSLP